MRADRERLNDILEAIHNIRISWREHREKPSTNGVNECTNARPYSFIRSLFVDGSPQ
jgi:hypothetical protein